MPIIRTYGDVGIFGQGAYDAGRGLARIRRDELQRDRDARFIENRLAARERITEIQTRANYAGQMQSQARPAQKRDSGPSSVISDFIKRQSGQQVEQNDQELADKQMIQDGLENAYSGREKDFTYYYAMDLLKKGKPLPDRILSSLGIESASESLARAKNEKELQSGQIDAAVPRTDRDRLIRRTLEQGRPGDIASMLDQVGKVDILSGGRATLTQEALAARTQLEGFASVTNDKQLLIDYRDELKEKGASDEALQALEDRIIELDEEEVELKAPAAFEQVISGFESRIKAEQKKQGRLLDYDERYKMLVSTIKSTAESFGMSVESLGEYIRANDENRRMAEMLVKNAQEVIAEMQQPSGQLTGTEQQYGPYGAPTDEMAPAEPAGSGGFTTREINTQRTY